MQLLLTLLFLKLRWIDIVDILLVAILIYQIYNLVKGSAAINIFIGMLLIYLLWIFVKALDMQLFSGILGKFIDVGGELTVLVEGDKRLFNQYGVIVVNPAKHPHVKKDLAQAFADWVVSPAGQATIASAGILSCR